MIMKHFSRGRIFRSAFITVFLAPVLLSSCHTARKAARKPVSAPPPPAVNAASPALIRSALTRNTIAFKTFSARAKVDFTSPRSSQKGIAAYVRMQRDSAIWISVRPVLGIELVRVLITPDSVKMINFFDKTITLRRADSMQQLLHIPYGFNALQDLILGNPLFLPDTLQHITVDTASSSIRFTAVKGDVTAGYELFADTYLLRAFTLTRRDSEARCSREEFGDYKLTQGRHFPGDRHLVFRSRGETTVDIRFSHVEFDKALDFPFPEVDKFTRE